jgi:hypothetical protein
MKFHENPFSGIVYIKHNGMTHIELIYFFLLFVSELEVTIATVRFTSGAWVCSFPFVLSEPEGLNRRVIYVGGLCKAHPRLLLADLRTQHIHPFIHPSMALQPLLGLGLPHKTPPFISIRSSSPPSSYPQQL